MYSQRELKAEALARALGVSDIGHLPAGIAPGSEWERKASTREASMRADVFVPLVQALVTGLLAAALGILALGWQAGALAGVLVSSGVWALLLFDHNAQLWQSERLLSTDAREEAAQAPAQRLVRVELASEDGKNWRWLDLPLDESKLERVARACLAQGVSLSRPGLCGAGILTQGEFNKMMAALLEAGLARDGVGNKRELSSAGRAFFRALLTTTV